MASKLDLLDPGMCPDLPLIGNPRKSEQVILCQFWESQQVPIPPCVQRVRELNRLWKVSFQGIPNLLAKVLLGIEKTVHRREESYIKLPG